MSKKIKFEFDGVPYTLRFTPRSLKRMEKEGFKFGKMDETLLTSPEELFCGAFYAEHPHVPRDKKLKIYKALKREMDNAPETEDMDDDTDQLTKVLGDMLADALNEITNRGGNVSWGVEE